MRVLIAEDDRAIRVTLEDELRGAGHDVSVASDGDEARSVLEGQSFDCVIFDIRMPGTDGVTLMKEVKERTPETEVILATGHGTMDSVLDALRAGAYDYLIKPFDNEQVVLALARLDAVRALRRENVALRRKLDHVLSHPAKLIGKSPGMLAVYDKIRAVAPAEANVLITGESGTGKEIVAEELHALSVRKDGPLVKCSCAALPETLIETELFGHEKGAFTGAHRSKSGRFTMADGGTIFLDDVDDVPLGIQPKLLRCIEEKEVWPVGGKPRKVDIRVIAATKVDLALAVKQGRFRDDLYFRLNVVRVDIPPLRERTEDIPLLVDHFLRLYGIGREYEVDRETMEAMLGHPWPGNVRELENAVERAIALAGEETVLDRANLLPSRSETPGSRAPTGTLADAVREAERRHIAAALEAAGGRRKEAADMLGISRKTLWEKAKKLGIV
jgi:DNA-binding NtrC family response regulator